MLSLVCKAEIFLSVYVHTHYLDTYRIRPFKAMASTLWFDKLLFFLTPRVNCVALPMENLFLDIDFFLTSIVKWYIELIVYLNTILYIHITYVQTCEFYK